MLAELKIMIIMNMHIWIKMLIVAVTLYPVLLDNRPLLTILGLSGLNLSHITRWWLITSYISYEHPSLFRESVISNCQNGKPVIMILKKTVNKDPSEKKFSQKKSYQLCFLLPKRYYQLLCPENSEEYAVLAEQLKVIWYHAGQREEIPFSWWYGE